jgi:hypothetical protein
MNSVVQAISQEVNAFVPCRRKPSQLLELCQMLWSEEDVSIPAIEQKTEKVLAAMRKYNPSLRIGRQHDAHEALVALLNYLRDTNKLQSDHTFYSLKETNVISCQSCSDESTKNGPRVHLCAGCEGDTEWWW